MVNMVFCTMFAHVGWSSRDTRAPVAPTIWPCWTVRGDAIIQCAPFALQKSVKNVFAPLPGCVLDRSAWCNRLDMDQDVALQAEPRVVDVAMMLNDVVFFVHSHVPASCRFLQTPNSHHLLYRKRPFRGETLHWAILSSLCWNMVLFLGKCAACGVGKNHKNFKGCREGRLVPDPCYMALRKRQPAKDDRLCKFVTIPISPMYPHCPGHLHLLLIRDKDLVRHLWMHKRV